MRVSLCRGQVSVKYLTDVFSLYLGGERQESPRVRSAAVDTCNNTPFEDVCKETA